MKFLIKSGITLCIIFFICLLLLNHFDGHPLHAHFVGNYLEKSDLNRFGEKINQFFSTSENSSVTGSGSFKAYQWKDERGVVHYSDKSSPDHKSKLTEFKQISVLPVYNEKSKAKTGHNASVKLPDFPGLTTIPLEQIPKLIKDSKQVKQMLEQRKNHMDKVIDEQ